MENPENLPKNQENLPNQLVKMIEKLYQTFAKNYCPNGIVENVGLQNEPYFTYFDYPDFLTPNSGIIQIRKFAEINSHGDLLEILTEIKKLSLEIKNEISRLLEKIGYFE